MDKLPEISIALVTCERTELALRTIRGIRKNLVYPQALIRWYVGDDGSSSAHEAALTNAITECGMQLQAYHNKKMSPGTYFAGKTWNRALENAHSDSEYVLWLEDDWELHNPLVLEPYLQMLSERTDVGMLRLGHLAVGSDVRIVGHGGIHYLDYVRSTQYAYSGNPSLRHIRFSRMIGPYAEDKNPGDIELDMDSRFRERLDIPSIWRPADIPGWGIFGHTGTEKSWK